MLAEPLPSAGLLAATQVGTRTYLRHPGPADVGEFVSLMAVSRQLHRPWVQAMDVAGFWRYLERARRPDLEAFLICCKDDDAIAGFCNLSQIFHGAFRNATCGYAAFAPSAGEGFLTEGVNLVLRHAFTMLHLHRVEANIQPGNERSRALAQRCGFRLEGYSPRLLKIGGRWRDHERWALTAEEWRARRAKPRRRAREAGR